MKNILKFITASALSLALFSSCIQDVVPTDGLTSEQVKEGYLTEMVNGIPVSMIAIGSDHNDFGYPALMIIRELMLEDMTFGGEIGYAWMWFSWVQNQSQGKTGANTVIWAYYYPWIKACNDVILLAKQNIAAGVDVEASKEALGMAYAYRASFYLDLARMYEYKPNEYVPAEGPIEGLTVPIVTEETTEIQAANNPRATREDIYNNRIFVDLAAAEEYLADFVPANISQPSLAVVYGLYARAYLELAQYDAELYKKAAEYARKAIDESGCTPLTESEWQSASSGFNSSNGQNSWMWGLIQTSENVNNIVSFSGFMAPEQTYGYCAITEGMFCFVASKAFYDMIPYSDFRKYSYIDPDPTVYNYPLCAPDRDAFFKAAPAYTSIKFRPAGGDCLNPKTGNASDVPMMRVEEMMLIEAEAAGMYNLAQGKQLLQEFMNTRITDGSYSMGYIPDAESLQQEIFKQKRIELWGEGQLYFDYKRLEAGVMRAYAGTNWHTIMKFNVEGVAPWWNIVIPQGEFQANPGLGDSDEMNNPDPSGQVPLAQ